MRTISPSNDLPMSTTRSTSKSRATQIRLTQSMTCTSKNAKRSWCLKRWKGGSLSYVYGTNRDGHVRFVASPSTEQKHGTSMKKWLTERLFANLHTIPVIWEVNAKVVSMSRFLCTNRSYELLEPYEGKLSRTVLRGERGSNVPALPDKLALAIVSQQKDKLSLRKRLFKAALNIDYLKKLLKIWCGCPGIVGPPDGLHGNSYRFSAVPYFCLLKESNK